MNPEDLDTQTLLLLLVGKLRERVQTNPWGTLAGAAGAGYVLGAGLPDVVVRMGGAAAVRAATNFAVSQLVQEGGSVADAAAAHGSHVTVEEEIVVEKERPAGAAGGDARNVSRAASDS